MRVLTFSREAIEAFTPDRPSLIVSFRDPGTSVPLFRAARVVAMSCVACHDVDRVPPGVVLPDWVVMFTFEMATQIAHAVLNFGPHVSQILCHCEAGVSRSVSAAAAIERALGLPQQHRVVNGRVYTTLGRAFAWHQGQRR